MNKHSEKMKELTKALRIKKRELIENSKTPCAKCGETRKYIIDLHHKNPFKKSFNINQFKEYGLKKVEDELKKCISLCRNCHAEFHYIYGQQATEEDLNKYLNENYNN